MIPLPCSWIDHRLEPLSQVKSIVVLQSFSVFLPIPLLHSPYRPAVIRKFSPCCTLPWCCLVSGNDPANGTKTTEVRPTHCQPNLGSWPQLSFTSLSGFPPSTVMKGYQRCRNSIFVNKLFTRFSLFFLWWVEGMTVVLFAVFITPLPFILLPFYRFCILFIKL